MGSFKKIDARSVKPFDFELCIACSKIVDEAMGTHGVRHVAEIVIPAEAVDFRAIIEACPTCKAGFARACGLHDAKRAKRRGGARSGN